MSVVISRFYEKNIETGYLFTGQIFSGLRDFETSSQDYYQKIHRREIGHTKVPGRKADI